MAPRAGLGLGIELSERVGLGFELGWMGSYSELSTLTLGYGAAALEFSSGAMTFGVGPMLAFGRGESTGLDAAALEAYCAGDVGKACNGLEYAQLSGSVLSGSVLATGPSLSAGVGILDREALQGAGVLLISMLSDGSRWYPIGQVGLQVSVGGNR